MEKENKPQTFDTTERSEINDTNPEAISTAIDALASALHEDWRKPRLGEDGKFEERKKPTKDEAWIADHGTNEVDIANSNYTELPEDWKAENKAAAEVIVGILDKKGSIDIANPDVYDKVGEIIHTAWLSRNEWAKGGGLDVPFVELPQDEKDKDINQVVVAQRVFTN